MKNSNTYIKKIISKLMPGISGNALTCASIEPLWAIFNGMIFFYMSLYMKSLGLSERQMGFILSFGAGLAVITSLFAGPITDKLGRKRTTLYFDIIAWTCAMAVWAISRNFWCFIFAAALNAFSKIPATSWTCLAIEDTPSDKRAIFFSLISIIGLGSGIFTPITGLMIKKLGITLAMRILFLLGCVSMTTMFFIRNHYVTETKIGSELMKLHDSISLKEKLIDYKNAMHYMITKPITLITLLILLLTNFQLAFQFFLVIYLKDSLGIAASVTSLIPGISALFNLFIYFIFIPRMIKKKETSNLSLGLILCVLGSLVFLFITRGNYVLLILSTILTASGNLIMGTFRDTLWNNVIGEAERAKIFAASQALISIIAIPSGAIAGYLYESNPKYPFVISLIIFIISMLLAFYTNKLNKVKKHF